MRKGKLYIGTSGWVYPHWNGIFYPPGLSADKKLEYFSQHFKTVEINYSFYHLPSKKAFSHWYKETPDNFLFAVKLSRYITHIKRLKEVKTALNIFLKRCSLLKEKLGPILVQFPPSFKLTELNEERLNKFLYNINILGKTEFSYLKMRVALEFRHSSWLEADIYKLLTRFKVALVFSKSSIFPEAEVITANFVYIRMHGPSSLFSSGYSYKQLKELSFKIKKYLEEGLDVYCYFNNDFSGFAIKNAEYLSRLLNEKQK